MRFRSHRLAGTGINKEPGELNWVNTKAERCDSVRELRSVPFHVLASLFSAPALFTGACNGLHDLIRSVSRVRNSQSMSSLPPPSPLSLFLFLLLLLSLAYAIYKCSRTSCYECVSITTRVLYHWKIATLHFTRWFFVCILLYASIFDFYILSLNNLTKLLINIFNIIANLSSSCFKKIFI